MNKKMAFPLEALCYSALPAHTTAQTSSEGASARSQKTNKNQNITIFKKIKLKNNL